MSLNIKYDKIILNITIKITMKENLIDILENLVKSNSWNLADDMLNWLKNIENIKPRYVLTIINFLENELKKSKDNTQIHILTEARDSLKLIKQEEQEERDREKQELDNLLLEY